MRKNINDLTIAEAEDAINEITQRNKVIDVKKPILQKKQNKQKDERVDLKDKKSERMKSIQSDAKKAKTKLAKENKRKQKERESNSFDRKIKSKEKEIRSTRGNIEDLNIEKKQNNQAIELLKQHIKKIKKIENMAIYGVGAFYDRDVSADFISQNLVGVGWDSTDAPELQEYFQSLKVGDIVYIKAAFGGKDITVKAIGIICDNIILRNNGLVSTGRNVKWLSTEKFVIGRPLEKNNVRSNTVYEEFHPVVLSEIISRIN